jgi:hypothetical protein
MTTDLIDGVLRSLSGELPLCRRIETIIIVKAIGEIFFGADLARSERQSGDLG